MPIHVSVKKQKQNPKKRRGNQVWTCIRLSIAYPLLNYSYGIVKCNIDVLVYEEL
jgi:hypothetical protein